MINDYEPRPLHMLFPIALTFGGWYAITQGWSVPGGFTLLAAALITWWMLHAATQIQNARYYEVLSRFAERISLLSPDQYQALGIRFPSLRVRWHGHLINYFEDTDVTLEFVQKFLMASNEYETQPRGAYGDGTISRRYHVLLIQWLEANNYVIPDSAVGNHSWMWRAGAYQQMCDIYLGSELNQAKAIIRAERSRSAEEVMA